MSPRIRQKPFDPKPFAVGSVVEVDGRTFTVQANGPLPSSRWAADEHGDWELVRAPTARRRADVIDSGLPGVSYADWSRQALARAEAIRHGVAVQGRNIYSPVVHATAGCPEATGTEPARGVSLSREAQRELNLTLGLAHQSSYGPVPTLCHCIGDAARDRAAA